MSAEDVVLLGWVHRIRDLGSLVFLDVRDRHGITQVVARENDALVAAAQRLRPEYVVAILGKVERRAPETVNPKMKTGEIEVAAAEIRLLNDAKTPPFPIADDSPVSEDTRLKYRYLDLRRQRMQRNMILRHKTTMEVRKFFDEQGFLEIETPMLTKSTPEGARDYLVPSRVHPGEFYALPQSPQIFKQILMISGMDRYFQIVKCFRDEDLRADRQPEFTQIDLEISFGTENLVFSVIEPLMGRLMGLIGRDAPQPFLRLPVLRGDCESTDRTSLISGSAWRSRSWPPRFGFRVLGVPRRNRQGRRRPRFRGTRRREVFAAGARRACGAGEAAWRRRPGLGATRRRCGSEPGTEGGWRAGHPAGDRAGRRRCRRSGADGGGVRGCHVEGPRTAAPQHRAQGEPARFAEVCLPLGRRLSDVRVGRGRAAATSSCTTPSRHRSRATRTSWRPIRAAPELARTTSC